MKEKMISVIIPIYKTQNYLERCIDSVLSQTYKNLEIILIDDGSPDESGKICDQYAKQDNRIIVIHKENGGLSDARNKGLDIAQGDYISFIDSDDYIKYNMFEKMINIAIEEDADIVHCNFKMVTEDGEHVNCKIKQFNQQVELNGYEALEAHVIDYKVQVMAWNKLYKKEIFKQLRFAKGYYYEDELLFPEVCKLSKKNIIIPEELYYYVYSPESITKGKLTETKIKSKQNLIAFWESYYEVNYSELKKHIYILICFTCVQCIKQIESRGTLEERKYINYFRDKYLKTYVEMKKCKRYKLVPIKKQIFCKFMYIYLLLKKG